MDFDEVAKTTCAVRKRLDLDRPVEPNVITECLQAPTGGTGFKPAVRCPVSEVTYWNGWNSPTPR